MLCWTFSAEDVAFLANVVFVSSVLLYTEQETGWHCHIVVFHRALSKTLPALAAVDVGCHSWMREYSSFLMFVCKENMLILLSIMADNFNLQTEL